MAQCDICDKDQDKLSQCRQCKANVCYNCMLGLKCADCAGEEEDDSSGVGKFPIKGY